MIPQKQIDEAVAHSENLPAAPLDLDYLRSFMEERKSFSPIAAHALNILSEVERLRNVEATLRSDLKIVQEAADGLDKENERLRKQIATARAELEKGIANKSFVALSVLENMEKALEALK